jgi:hypothetical protein
VLEREVEVQSNNPFNTWNISFNSSGIRLSQDVMTGNYSTEYTILVNTFSVSDYVASNYTYFKLYPANQPHPLATTSAKRTPLPVFLPVISLGLAGGICLIALRKKR